MLSSVEAIMNVFAREESLGRPMDGAVRERNGNSVGIGIAWSEGDFWRKKRAIKYH
jgi:hypothetical protein